ncbi:hypothetical protein Patl1_11764 [Pistacia atlantica]|uniref:Uncharacterized protein n=1 Tax=Pistacia atlantica TaxID=434234 RepID=A0ACC1A6C8_9ROSI|nr:hypothetical protein Patl1_11764 [Pistacia atlantica]
MLALISFKGECGMSLCSSFKISAYCSFVKSADDLDESDAEEVVLVSKEVLGNYTDTENNFSVEALSHQEARNLFDSIVGDLTLPDLAVEIVKRCAGLPLTVKAIGNALNHNKSLSFCQKILEDLKNFKGVDKEVDRILKLSYEFLESEEAKSLFLLCAVCTSAGDKISTDNLLKIGVGLDSGVDDKFVKMSHTMHSVAVSIAEDGGQVYVSIPEGANSREMLANRYRNNRRAKGIDDSEIFILRF